MRVVMWAVAVVVVVAAGMVQTCAGMYAAGDGVEVLTAAEFAKVKAGESGGPVFVEFFAPWCGHCKNLAGAWKGVAKALKGVVRVAGVDGDAHMDISKAERVMGFPTIHLYVPGREHEVYNGDRTEAKMVEWVMDRLAAIVRAQGGAKAKPKAKAKKAEKAGSSAGKSAVVDVTAATFDDVVRNADGVVMVEFFAPWCGHCKNLAPEWEAAAAALAGKAVLAAVDATVETALASEFDIQGFPTILVFGASDTGEPVRYEGARTAAAITEYVLELVTKPTTLEELVSADVYAAECVERKLCFLAVLPPVEDTGASGRNVYLDALRVLTAKYAPNHFGWVWTSALVHPSVEDAFDIGGAGYPAVVAVNARKQLYVPFRGALSADGLARFVDRMLRGAEATYPFRADPAGTIAVVEAWDGTGEVYVDDDAADTEWDDEMILEFTD